MARTAFVSFVAAFALALCLAPNVADAQMYRDGPPPKHRVVYRDLTAFRANPLGFITDARLLYRYRLYQSDSLALRDNFISIGAAPILSAGYARAGIQAEFQPLTILNLWALYEWVGYLGTFNHLQSFPSATSPYDDSRLKELGSLASDDPAKNYAATGAQLTVGANLTLKVKDIVVRTQVKLARADMNLRPGDRVFYDTTFDLLVENGTWMLNNDTDVLWSTDGPLTLGVRWTQAKAFFTDTAFAPDDDRDAAPGMTHRVGPLAAYTWKKEDGAAFEGTVIAVLNWWVSHQNRIGQDVSQLAPYFVLGFAMTGDLTPDFMK